MEPKSYVCNVCFKEFIPKYKRHAECCSRKCGFKYAQIKRHSHKKPRELIKSLCFPVINFINALKSLSDCHVCGKRFISKYGNTICSNKCKSEHYLQIRKNKKNISTYICKECGQAFRPEYRDKRKEYCSNKCCDKAYKKTKAYKQRHKLHKGGISKAKRQRVFERDNYICQICYKKVRMDVISTVGTGKPHPLAPTIDHIIPRSQCKEYGWTKAEMNKERNLNTAHFICNVKKSNKAIGQQLRLC